MRSKYDAYMAQHDPSLIDYSYTDPLAADGSNFPCKGYQIVSEPSVASYIAGQTYNVSITGGATHNGGTCQLGLSIDGGSTFKVIKTMIGGCPLTLEYDFTIPGYTPSKQGALFTWLWINHSGNREFYMDCAFVDIVGSSSYTLNQQTQMWEQLPNIFVAQLSGVNSCLIPEGYDAVPPNPGPDVVYGSNSSLYHPPATWHCEVPFMSYTADPSYSSDPSASSSSAISPKYLMPLIMAEMQPQSVSSPSIPVSAALMMAQFVPNSDPSTSSCDPNAATTTYVTVTAEEPCTTAPPITVTRTIATITITPSSVATTLMTLPSSHAPSSQPPPASSAIPYADPANLSLYLPCVHGTFLCTSPSEFLTCDQPDPFTVGGSGWGWVLPRGVAAGMMCLPYLSPGVGAGQMPGAPVGMYRDDRYVAAA